MKYLPLFFFLWICTGSYAQHPAYFKILPTFDTTYHSLLAFECIEEKVETQRPVTSDRIAYFVDQSITNPNHIWYETNYSGRTGEYFSRRYRFAEDSITPDGWPYYEILRSNEESGEDWDSTGIFLRGDGPIVHMWDQSKGGFDTLYDFSLMPGDTFTLANTFWDPSDTLALIVTEVDSIELFNGSKRKRLHFVCTNDPDPSDPWYGEILWIEGIGNTRGLLYNDASCLVDINDFLLCFSANEEFLYRNPDFDQCWFTTSTDVQTAQELKVYPNPSSHFVRIENDMEVIELIIYDMMGRPVYQNKGRHIQEIPVARLTSGTYYLRVKDASEKLWRATFVKL